MVEALLPSIPSSTPTNPGSGFELLCACASRNPALAQEQRIANWDYAGFDWNGFLRLAEHHGVLALVAHNLISHAGELPAEVAQSLRSSYAANLQRNLWFAGELTRILEHLSKSEVRAIPYKGPVLAQSAYGDLGLRSFSDLDLLISRVDFERAKRALGEIGYHPSQALSPAVERLFLRTGYERSFDGLSGKNLLELQWNLLPHFYAVDSQAAAFGVEDLLARAGRIRLGAGDVPCLSAEDSLLVLCLHAAKHLWTRLIWIADIAESLRAPDIDFALVVRRARALGIARIVGVSCWLAERLLGAAIPAPAREVIEHDPEVPKLGEEYAARLARASTYNFDSTEYFRQVWRLRERPSDRCRYLWRLASTPGPGEIAAIELPESLFPLYRVVRIGRLLRRLV
ncbi:MAG: nucleotidyltransferase family protein [Terriglobales bacterium]